jgi:hypothetical protein
MDRDMVSFVSPFAQSIRNFGVKESPRDRESEALRMHMTAAFDPAMLPPFPQLRVECKRRCGDDLGQPVSLLLRLAC